MKKKTLILCDFDGTITETDVTDILLSRFASEDWEAIGKAYVNGSINHGTMNTRFAQMLIASPEEVDLFLKTISLRPGFTRFLSEVAKQKMSFFVVSSGWDYYIRILLQEYNPHFLSSDTTYRESDSSSLQVIANSISFDSTEKRWNFLLQWNKNACHFSSPCKGQIVKKFRNYFDHIIVIGNSESDICMAKCADSVFAFGSLQQLCREKDIFAKDVTSFEEVRRQLFHGS